MPAAAVTSGITVIKRIAARVASALVMSSGYNLMTVTREMNTVNNDTYYGYVLAAGTRFFTGLAYLTIVFGGEARLLMSLWMLDASVPDG